MALFKSRPNFEVRVPNRLAPGQRFVAEVTAFMKRDVEVEFVDAWLTGVERAVVGSGNSAASAQEYITNLHARLMGPGKLAKGQQSFRCRFEIPEGAPPSYQTLSSTVSYRLMVHASIAWWPDRRSKFILEVAPKPQRGAPSPFVFASAEGPAGSEPYVEASVADQIVVPGEVLEGRVALFNAAFHGVKIAFVGRQTSRVGKRQATVDVQRYELTLPIQDRRDGDAIPFRTRVPALAPSFRSKLLRLDWVLRVSGMRRLARDVSAEAPLLVLPAGTPDPDKPRQAPPAVGTPRLNEVWAYIARELDMELSGEALHAKIGPVRIVVQQELRQGAGVYLVARLGYPSLGLSLDGGVLSGFSRLWGGAERVKRGEHYFAGRDTAQVEAFVDALALVSVDATIADVNDEELLLEKGEATQRHSEIHAFAVQALAIAKRWERAVGAIPPPAAFSDESVAAWRRLAAGIGAELVPASMSAAGQFEGRRARAETRFDADGAPMTTVVTLAMEPPIVTDVQSWNAEEGGDVHVSGGDAAVAALKEACLAFEVERELLSATLPAPLPSEAPALSAFARLVDLEIALRTQRSGYR
ncbi:MAG: hypothetical protein KC776_03945 [Myxococcales bacterium]|nr:hypothetical protein [Myxococcales bacterium]MCB9580148.1 hypothetical protein [Polyangiaceae bacterium]